MRNIRRASGKIWLLQKKIILRRFLFYPTQKSCTNVVETQNETDSQGVAVTENGNKIIWTKILTVKLLYNTLNNQSRQFNTYWVVYALRKYTVPSHFFCFLFFLYKTPKEKLFTNLKFLVYLQIFPRMNSSRFEGAGHVSKECFRFCAVVSLLNWTSI